MVSDMSSVALIIVSICLPVLIMRMKDLTANDNFELFNLSKILAVPLGYHSLLYFYHQRYGMGIDSIYIYFYRSIGIVLTIGFIVAVLRYSPLRYSIKDLLVFPRLGRTSLFYIIILLFFVINSFSAFLLVDLFPGTVNYKLNTYIDLIEIKENPLVFIPILILLEIFTIAGEELVFRYFAVNSLKQKLNKLSVIIISSLLWTLSHGSLSFGIFVVGIFLGHLYYTTESITLCVVLHFIFNLSVLSVYLYVFYKNIGAISVSPFQYAAFLLICQLLIFHISEVIITNRLRRIKTINV